MKCRYLENSVVIFIMMISQFSLYRDCYCSNITSDKMESDKLSFTIVALLPVHKENYNSHLHKCFGKIDEGMVQILEALYFIKDSMEK